MIDAARTIPARNACTCLNLDLGWLAYDVYMTWARRGFEEGDAYGLSNCVVYAKRAVCRRIDALLWSHHLRGFMGSNYPKKIETLGRIGIPIPGIVHELVIDPRNAMEHVYEGPNAASAERALGLADLLLRATQEEDARRPIVALNWGILGGSSSSAEGMTVRFRGHGREPMLFIDVFAEPHSVKIVDGANNEVRYTELDSFKPGEAIELARIISRHYSEQSEGESGSMAVYYQEMKRQGGF